MIKFLLTCDSYKDCLSAKEVVDALALGLENAGCNKNDITSIPLADGGEGSLETIIQYKDCIEVNCKVYDPLFRNINTIYLLEKNTNTAYIEMAKASGLELLKEKERNAWETSSYGTGQLILDAIDRGADQIYLFIGGSATNDLGIPIAAVCGFQFLDEEGEVILYPRGKDLVRIREIIPPDHNKLKEVAFFTICDVDNPLTGEKGASFVYGKQKGLKSKEVKILDKAMSTIADLMEKKINKSIKGIAGSGAAGGIGGGSIAFLNSQLISGGKFMLQLTNMNTQIGHSDMVITGEGRMDIQTFNGKLIAHIADQSYQQQKDLIAVCGKIELTDEEVNRFHIKEAISLADLTENSDYTSESTKELLFSVGKYIYNKYLGK